MIVARSLCGGTAAGTNTTLSFLNNEVQTITISPDSTRTSGNYVISLVTPDGVTRTTTALAFNDSATTVQRALEVMLTPVPGAVVTVASVQGVNSAATGT